MNLLNNNQRHTRQNSLSCATLLQSLSAVKKLVIALFIVAMFPLLGYSQDDKSCEVSFDAGADVVSSYVWRGQKYDGFSFQPTANIYLNNLYVGAWGTVGEDYKELDLYVGYEFGNAWVEVMDYWCPQGSHVFEGTVGYDFGVVNFAWSTNFAGDDGINKKGNRAYSSYFCANAPFSLLTCDWAAEVGIVPWATDYYEDVTGFAVTDISLSVSKSVELSAVNLSLMTKLSYNPVIDDIYWIAGVNISL